MLDFSNIIQIVQNFIIEHKILSAVVFFAVVSYLTYKINGFSERHYYEDLFVGSRWAIILGSSIVAIISAFLCHANAMEIEMYIILFFYSFVMAKCWKFYIEVFDFKWGSFVFLWICFLSAIIIVAILFIIWLFAVSSKKSEQKK